MKARRDWLLSLLACSGLVLGLSSAPAFAGDLYKCQQGIEKESVKIQGLILKALQLCKDKYRQTVVKVNKLNSDSNPGNDTTLAVELPKVTTACDGLLAKTIGIPGGNLGTLGVPPSQVQKTYDKLMKLTTVGTPPKCEDGELLALGHLPKTAYGDAWIRWIIMAMLKGAYEKQVWLVGDTPGIMGALCDANGNGTPGEPAGPTGDCPTCCKLQVPPCFTMTCRLAGASNATLQLLDGGSNFSLGLGKELASEYCQYSDFIGSDIAVVGGPSRTVDEIVIPATARACVTQLRAEGFIKCGGSSFFNGPKNVTLCADSDGANPPCGTACQPAPATSITSCATGPGPICQTLGTPAVTNDSVILSTLQIETVVPLGPCTGSGGNVVPTILTTGNVTLNFVNYTPACSGTYTDTVTGVAGTCPAPGSFLDSEDLAGTTLVGGFPAYQSSAGGLGDTATTFSLICEP